MARYEFIDLPIKGGLKAGKTDTLEECKEIIRRKAEEGWELVQVLPLGNEKTGIGLFLGYTIIFKVEEALEGTRKENF